MKRLYESILSSTKVGSGFIVEKIHEWIKRNGVRNTTVDKNKKITFTGSELILNFNNKEGEDKLPDYIKFNPTPKSSVFITCNLPSNSELDLSNLPEEMRHLTIISKKSIKIKNLNVKLKGSSVGISDHFGLKLIINDTSEKMTFENSSVDARIVGGHVPLFEIRSYIDGDIKFISNMANYSFYYNKIKPNAKRELNAFLNKNNVPMDTGYRKIVPEDQKGLISLLRNIFDFIDDDNCFIAVDDNMKFFIDGEKIKVIRYKI